MCQQQYRKPVNRRLPSARRQKREVKQVDLVPVEVQVLEIEIVQIEFRVKGSGRGMWVAQLRRQAESLKRKWFELTGKEFERDRPIAPA